MTFMRDLLQRAIDVQAELSAVRRERAIAEAVAWSCETNLVELRRLVRLAEAVELATKQAEKAL